MNTFKSKNLILIIGNGFDLAHKFKTSFNDFANYIIEDKISPELLESDNQIYDDSSLIEKSFIDELNQNNLFNPEGDFIKRITYYQRNKDVVGITKTLILFHTELKSILKNEFLGKLFNNQYENWFDIENSYFLELTSIEEQNIGIKEKKILINSLNDNLEEIKFILFEYLKSIETEKNHHISSFFNLKQFNFLEKIYVINFNYTITLENYLISDEKTIINYIHGDIESQDIIFGYGNDQHINYKKLKLSGIDEYLKFFKTFQYLKNKNYSEIYEKALDFFNDYDVAILGHSLGQTDKTLLKEILNNPKCKRIQLYKRSDLSNYPIKVKEEFDKLIFSISRIIDNEKDLRVKVLNFDDSSFFP